MDVIDIPGWGQLEARTLVLDLNGTLAESGEIIPGVFEDLRALLDRGLEIFVLSGDTRGTLQETFAPLERVQTVVARSAGAKRIFVDEHEPEHLVCVGNGNIDIGMFRAAKLAICTIQAEGATTAALSEADIVVHHIRDAFGLLLDPSKLIATLRS